jgi:hypothetical protein
VESFRAELELFTTTSHISLKDRWDHFLARWGIRRNQHRVKPGLYRLGAPGPRASVFVTANYTLSFDALRSALNGIDAYILVLDTHGINVWCAAAKGTFSTQELVGRIESTHLREIVKGRVLILPQLGAAGVSAHEVKRLSHFKVEYGPVRASDLAKYLETHQASAEMRRVKFDLWDRLVLVPVEVVHTFLPMLAAAINTQFQYSRTYPGRDHITPVCSGKLIQSYVTNRLAKSRLVFILPGNNSTGGRLPGIEFYWFYPAYFKERCAAGNVTLFTSNDRVIWIWGYSTGGPKGSWVIIIIRQGETG